MTSPCTYCGGLMAWVDAVLQAGSVETVWQCLMCAKEPPRQRPEAPTPNEIRNNNYTERTIALTHTEGHHIARQRPAQKMVMVECDLPGCDVLKERSPYRVHDRNYCCIDHHREHRRQRGWHPKPMKLEFKP